MNSRTVVMWVALALIVAGFIAFGVPRSGEQGTVCTLEARQCPDGSYVGRTGPKCEFAPCSGATSTLENSYENPNAGFSIRYGADMAFVADKEKIQQLAYVPLCDPETSLACIVYPETLLPGRNFQGGGVAVGILSDRADETSCYARTNEMEEGAPVTIDGRTFRSFRYSDAAMSHQVAGENYRTFTGGKCYQISTRIETTTYEVYEPGTIARFTDDERKTVEDALGAVVRSFRFTASGSGPGGQGILPYRSGIRGTVMQGPTCPVMHEPPDPSCADKPYQTLVAVFRASDPVHAMALLESDAEGAFSVALPPGDYVVGAGERELPRCAHVSVSVGPDTYASVTVACDTGIR